MKIEINNDRKIFGIQEEFNALYPNLKIEFYEKPSTLGGHPSKKLVKSSSKPLAECRTMHNTGFISILPGMTYNELKQNFSDIYGLSIEMFQKSANNTWSEIIVHEKLSLEELNKSAGNIKSS